jgi:hypothetical protein
MKQVTFNLLMAGLFIPLWAYTAYGQASPCDKSMEESLQQVASVLNRPESKALWGVALNAPIIIVDHFNNTMFFTAIEEGHVSPVKEEPWNNQVPLANSFADYNGQRYVTVIHAALMNTPCEQRVNLLCHEIFHTYQQGLGIDNRSSVNYHMDEVQGRALLQIEMKMLQQVLSGDRSSLRDALRIRAYRQGLYPNNNEDLYELNEGLAEYTGLKLSMENMRDYVKNGLRYNISKGYANAFGYVTGAAYALVLDELYPQWRSDKDLAKGMIYLIKKIEPSYAAEIDTGEPDEWLVTYDYLQILANEQEELDRFGNIDTFKDLLKPEASKFSIAGRGVSFTYNPNDRVISLGDAVLLRNMTMTGEWGQIHATNGLVRLNNWSAFYLLPPSDRTTNVIRGDNYEIRLNPGWTVSEKNGMYELVKEQE